MTPTDAEKQEAIDAAQAAGFKVVKVGTGQKVKDPEKIALVEAAEQVLEPEPAANHETVTTAAEARPGPAPAQEGSEFTLWATGSGVITARVLPDMAGVYRVEFLKAGERIHTETTKGPVWESTKLQDNAGAHLAAALNDETISPEFVRKRIREAFGAFAERITTDKQVQQALLSEPARKVLEMTKVVDVYPSKDGQGTIYEVTLGDRVLTATPAQMGGKDGGFLNSAWKGMFYKSLDLSRKDWMQIRARWEDPDLMKIHEIEESTETEITIERLRENLRQVDLVPTAAELIGERCGWMDEGTSRVWILNVRIARFIEDELKKPPGYTSVLSKMLRAAGAMPDPSKKMRGIGLSSGPVRVWGFDRGFAWEGREVRSTPLSMSDAIPTSGRGDE